MEGSMREAEGGRGVTYFVMGHMGGWKTCAKWPPPSSDLILWLGPAERSQGDIEGDEVVTVREDLGSGGGGVLAGTPLEQPQHRFQHAVEAWKHPKVCAGQGEWV